MNPFFLPVPFPYFEPFPYSHEEAQLYWYMFYGGYFSGGGQTAPAKQQPAVCRPYDAKTKSIDLSCYHQKYEELKREYPNVVNQHPQAHCGKQAQYFTDRIYVIKPDGHLMEKNPSKDPNAAPYRISCNLPTLTDVLKQSGTSLETGALTYAMVKGKDLAISPYFCHEFGYMSMTADSPRNFKEVEWLIQQPFRLENYGPAYCGMPTQNVVVSAPPPAQGAGASSSGNSRLSDEELEGIEAGFKSFMEPDNWKKILEEQPGGGLPPRSIGGEIGAVTSTLSSNLLSFGLQKLVSASLGNSVESHPSAEDPFDPDWEAQDWEAVDDESESEWDFN